jgi:hypothetical protein
VFTLVDTGEWFVVVDDTGFIYRVVPAHPAVFTLVCGLVALANYWLSEDPMWSEYPRAFVGARAEAYVDPIREVPS